MDQTAEKGQCTISSTDALNMRTEGATQMTQQLTQEQLAGVKRLSIREKEALLEQLVNDQWLCLSDNGAHYFIGVRLGFASSAVLARAVIVEAWVACSACLPATKLMHRCAACHGTDTRL